MLRLKHQPTSSSLIIVGYLSLFVSTKLVGKAGKKTVIHLLKDPNLVVSIRLRKGLTHQLWDPSSVVSNHLQNGFQPHHTQSASNEAKVIPSIGGTRSILNLRL